MSVNREAVEIGTKPVQMWQFIVGIIVSLALGYITATAQISDAVQKATAPIAQRVEAHERAIRELQRIASAIEQNNAVTKNELTHIRLAVDAITRQLERQ